MNNGFQVIKESIPNQQAGVDLLNRIYDVARPEAVFSEPESHGEYSAITASEVSMGIGYGYGGGGGSGTETGDDAKSNGEPSVGYGAGGGGGGGGGAAARPVAVIEIGPHGVRVEPIVDPTKIAIAFFTAFGAMFMMLNRMRQQARG